MRLDRNNLVFVGFVVAVVSVIALVYATAGGGSSEVRAETMVVPTALDLDPARYPMTATSILRTVIGEDAGDVSAAVDTTIIVVVEGTGSSEKAAQDDAAERAELVVDALNRSGRGRFAQLPGDPVIVEPERRSVTARALMGGIAGLATILAGLIVRQWWRRPRAFEPVVPTVEPGDLDGAGPARVLDLVGQNVDASHADDEINREFADAIELIPAGGRP